MNIAMMDKDGEFIVKNISLRGETGKRLADLGFSQGAHGRIIRKGAFGGPLHIRLDNCDVIIRASEAAGVDIEPFAASGTEGPARNKRSRQHNG